MPKYFLKKDLPFVNYLSKPELIIGDLSIYTKDDEQTIIVFPKGVGMTTDEYREAAIQTLINQGWIEEVKEKTNSDEVNFMLKKIKANIDKRRETEKDEVTRKALLRASIYIMGEIDDLEEVKPSPEADKKPREFIVLLNGRGEVIDTIKPIATGELKGGFAYGMPGGLYRGQVVNETIKVVEEPNSFVRFAK